LAMRLGTTLPLGRVKLEKRRSLTLRWLSVDTMGRILRFKPT
jgi:hypothetical protein